MTNNEHKFVGGVLYVLSPTEGFFKFFLHINELDRSKIIGTLLLQMIQIETSSKLKTNNILAWIEVHLKLNHQREIPLYYKRLGIHLTPPEKHNIQKFIPASVL